MKKYRIKNEEIKSSLFKYFGEEYVWRKIEEQMDDHNSFVWFDSYSRAHRSPVVSMRVSKSEFEPVWEYQPNEWNPYPAVTPPEDGKYLVTVVDDDGVSFSHFATWYEEDGKWAGLWSNNRILAFRACPEPYEPPKEQD